jgi:hypothetical protein
MAPHAQVARIPGMMLAIFAASTLAGCAATPLVDARIAQNTGAAEDIPDSISDSRGDDAECHVLRDTFLDAARVSVNIFWVSKLPIVFLQDENCPR